MREKVVSLEERKQRLLLNGQSSTLINVNAGESQSSVLGLLLFLIYINDLSDSFTTNSKLFADDTPSFSVKVFAFINDIQSKIIQT